MAKKPKLLTALDIHRGRDHNLEKHKKLRKQAEKKKRAKVGEADPQEKEHVEVKVNGTEISTEIENEASTSQPIEDETGNSGNIGSINTSPKLAASEPSSGTSDPEEIGDQEDENEECIALSDIDSLASSEKADILPHQRLTINNTAALLKAYKSISLAYTSLPFSAHQTLTTSAPSVIPDVNDDLNRELAFYKQCLDAANEGRTLLKKEGIPFSRPNDYFAEMVKSDEHMGRIKQKMVDEAANKKAASEARRQRDLKKFGKQVQVVKEQERAQAKKDTLNKIDLLKRKRKNTDAGGTNEEDLFDIALEDAAKEDGRTMSDRKGVDAKAPNKRRKKDEKFGFGGKKRFSKSGDALSTGDMLEFSILRMKGKKGGLKRLGKSRRAKVS